jgi:hypothetical protein
LNFYSYIFSTGQRRRRLLVLKLGDLFDANDGLC